MPGIRFHPFSPESELFIEPPKPATLFLPAWYKKQPGTIDDKASLPMGVSTSTVKRCMPIFDSMTAGYVITAPCDIFIDATNPDSLVYSIPASLAHIKGQLFATHDIKQYEHYPIDKSRQHKDLLRIHPFWMIETDPGYSCLIIQPQHSDDSPLTAISGIIDTDKFIVNGHFSFIVDKSFNGIIKQGTPLVQVIPFKRENFVSSLGDYESAKKITEKQGRQLRSVFMNGYKNKFRSKKQYE